MKKYLIIGGSGQLGQAMSQLLDARDTAALVLNQEQADLSHPETLTLPLAGISAVFNCAAYTAVDAAEVDEKTATQVNGHAVGVIAKQCREASVPLVHFSTDYVFDGQGTTPLAVETPRAPLSAYGRSKALGEELLEASGAEYLLVRTSWVYAPWGNNFVNTMARLMSEKPELKIVDDQIGRPTHALGLAQRSLELLERGERGTFHVTDEGECTWFGFAAAIAETLGSDCRLSPCTTSEFPRPAPRPAYGVLSSAKADALLGPATHYKEWLKKTLL